MNYTTKNLLNVPIEYRVLAYKFSWDKSDEIIYVSKISDFAVKVTDLTNGHVNTNIFFEPAKYNDKKPTEKSTWSYVRTDDLLEKLGIRRILSLNIDTEVEQILKPINNTAKWYETARDITLMFRKDR